MAAFLATAFVAFALIGRVAIQFYTTGNHGIRLADPTKDPVAAVAGAAFVLSFVIGLIIIALDFYQFRSIPGFAIDYLSEAALAVGLLGVAVVFIAQLQMGNAWRIGVDPQERTELITYGLFRRSRNPIYFGLGLYWVSLSVLLPHPAIWTLGIICWISIECIVRKVEEPYLRELHGARFEDYVRRSNRYLFW